MKKLVICWLLVAGSLLANGQLSVDVGDEDIDTNYIESYYNDLVLRAFTSTKYTETGLNDSKLQQSLVYHPNDRTNLGFGINYRWLGLNLGFNLGFINHDDDIYGETKYVDLQTQFYLRKFVIDFYWQYYSGFYLENTRDVFENWPDDGSYYIRSDIASFITGASVQYIFNHRKFSYRAAYLQNERQLKSAGSWTLGGAAYFSGSYGDSSFIPSNIKYPEIFDGKHFNASTGINLGFNGGYGHNFVIKSKFFFTVSLVAGLALGASSIHLVDQLENTDSGLTADFTATSRVALGYNNRRFFAGLAFVNLFIRSNSPLEKMWHIYNSGKIRFNIAYRFSPKKELGILGL
jgi:hypothetical protein